MSNILTDWSDALIAHLKANLQKSGSVTPWADDTSGFEHVRAGERDGLVRDRKLCVVFPPAEALPTDSGDIEFARPPMIIRAWLPRAKQPRADSPMNPSPLQQLAVDLATCLQPVQSTLLPGRIVFWIADTEIDQDDWGVQATLTSWAINPATIA